MTIIKPSQYQTYIRFFILVFVVVLLGGIIYIFEYNALVDARFQLKTLKQDIVALQVANADFKNNLYTVIDPAHLESLAYDRSLVLERNPEYLTSYQWLSDSSH